MPKCDIDSFTGVRRSGDTGVAASVSGFDAGVWKEWSKRWTKSREKGSRDLLIDNQCRPGTESFHATQCERQKSNARERKWIMDVEGRSLEQTLVKKARKDEGKGRRGR